MKNKKLIIVLSLLLVLALGLIYVFAVEPKIPPKVLSLSDEGLPTEGVNLVAHRGFSAVAPENSAAAFREAGKAKFFAAECDIQLTKDQMWIVNHDSDIKKMTNGKGEISQMTYDELTEFTLDGGYHSKDYPNQKLITLDEYLDICDEYKIIPQIEIKSGNNDCLDKIFTALDKFGGMRESAIIISFDGDILKGIRDLDSKIEIWYLTHEITDEVIKACLENDYAIGFNCKKYDAEMIKKAQDKNIKLASWTVDDPKIYRELYDLGVRNFTTNRLTK